MRLVTLEHEVDWAGWRTATRALVLAAEPPEAVTWRVGEGADLLSRTAPLPEATGTFNVPRPLVDLAETSIQHQNPERFALLYALIWRAQAGERRLLEMTTDPMVQRASRMAQAVRRDTHKMRAFLRFRAVEEPGEETRYVGWFEPDHFIVEANAGFFQRRFATMPWTILTPYRSALWDKEFLSFGPGADPRDVPDDDALERYWRTYFGAIFNPARLKVGAMLSEMPRKYWKNLPEAAAIPEMIRAAESRMDVMLEQTMPPTEHRAASRAMPAAPRSPMESGGLAQAAEEAEACRRCHLWEPATQTVFGEGPQGAKMMMIGEQPGDQEDLVGRPFVGPAGQVLDRALAEAGIDRRALYVTNAVKHFKFEPRGKRRIHAKPEQPEIVACKFWLDIELREVAPLLVVLLGATAARAALNRAVTIGRERGRRIALPDGRPALVTVHPSFLLRLPDEAAKQREYTAFVSDLRMAASLAAELSSAA